MLSQSRFVLEIVNQAGFYACVLREISVLTELILGHLCYLLTDVPPQPNSPPDYVFNLDHTAKVLKTRNESFTFPSTSSNK